jgi:hypothetical protein
LAVTLSTPASAGGVTVTLKSSDTLKVTVTPASVVIPEGATTPATQPQVTGVGIGSATITATATGYTPGSGTVTVSAPTMSFTGAPLVIAIGGTRSLTLSLTGGQAPTGGLTVSLSSSDTGKVTVPGAVSFAAGATSATVSVTGVASGAATITASAPNIANATTGVTVTPPPIVTASYGANFLQAINVVLTNTTAVKAVNLRITNVTNITAVAPNVIALRPHSGFPWPLGDLPGGQANAWVFQFEATAGSIEVPFSFTITYEADNMPSRSAVIDVPFPRSMSFAASPLALNSGTSGTLTLNLTGNQAPAGGLTVTLSSSDPSRATVPATVSFAAGATSVAVPVTALAPGSATITANATVVNFPATATATVTVTGAIKAPTSTTVGLGRSASFAVSLPAPAAAGRVTVTLQSSDTARVTVTPASVVIPQGATTPATQPQVTGAGIGSSTITATATGYTSGSGTVTVAAPAMAFTGVPAITIGFTGNLTLSLTGGQAPAGGLTVSLSSSDSGRATVPATMNLAAGATSVIVPVTGVTAGTATITASAPNIAKATTGVTVTPPPTVTASYAANSLGVINVILTNTSAVTAINLRIVSITNITAAAPNVIALLPNNVFPIGYGNVAGGRSAINGALFTATAGSLSVPFHFTITYQADNMPPRTAVIDVPFPRSMSFAASPLAINAGSSGNLTLNLLGNEAPAGGLTVSLSSSDPSRATVPASVTFAAGATSVSVPVTGLAPGTTTITANATVVNFPATATATVNVTGAIGVPASTTVGLGRSASFAVTLPAPAAAGGVTVTLKSSDVSKVTVPASVVIAQGATTPAAQPQVTGAGIGSATITASATGFTSGSGTVTVSAPAMAFAGAPLSITIGFAGNLTLNLTGGQAPAGGLTVNLISSDTSKATVPATVSFAPGASSATVAVTGVAAGTATITASAANIANATAAVTVTPPPTVTAVYSANFLQTINFLLTNTSAVTAVNLRVISVTNITAAAPNVIVLRSNNVLPLPVGNLPGGQSALRGFIFDPAAGSSIEVPFSFTLTLQADNMPPRTAVINVPFPRAMSFSGSPLSINAGASGNLTLNLLGNQAPAGGLTVNLSSSDPSRATVPPTVTFAAGTTSVNVAVTGVAVGTAVITANATVVNFPATDTATVNVTGVIGVPANTTVGLGQSASFAVKLVTPAPAGGVTVTLKNSDPSKITIPASVVIPQGATTPAAQPQVTGVGIGSATITASATGYTPSTGIVAVPAPAMAFTGAPWIITIGFKGSLTLSLTGGQAPAGGLTVNLTSSDIGKATVPAAVSLAAGATSATVSVTGVAVGPATITASAANIAQATAGVTVTPPPTVTASYGANIARAISLMLSNTSTVTAVNLRITGISNVTAAAPNVIVFDPPPPVPRQMGNLPGGGTSGVTLQLQATAGSLDVPCSFTVTYEADNMPSRSAVINVPFPRLMSFSGSPLGIAAGTSGNLRLNLTGNQAPAGGLTVNLTSSDPRRATVPATVTFPAGATSVNVPVTGIAAGSVLITANATVVSSLATATATVNVSGFVSPPNIGTGGTGGQS